MQYTIFDVANWFLNKSSMSHKKLQKLCYYAYSWVLTLNNESKTEIENRLFNEKIEAWVHGPVCPILYHDKKSYKWNDIPIFTGEIVDFPSDIIEILNSVYNVYGKMSATELEDRTHSEKPWIEAMKGLDASATSSNEIKDIDIFEYYNKENLKGL